MSIPLSLLNRIRGRHDRRPLLGATGMLLVALLGSVSLFATGPTPVPEPRAEHAWPVSAVHAEPGTARPTLAAIGRVESTRVATLRTDLTLAVRRVHVHEGDWVTEGQLLVELEDAEPGLVLAQRAADLTQAEALVRALAAERDMLRATLEQARSMHAVSQAKLERHQALRARGLISQSLVDEVQAEADRSAIQRSDHERRLAELPHRLRALEAQVERAAALVELGRLDLARTRIVAPFAGPVLEVTAAEGDRTVPGTPLVTVAAADSYEVRVQVPTQDGERFQAWLRAGERVGAWLPGRYSGWNGATELVRVAGRVRPGQSGLDAFFALQIPAGLQAAAAPGTPVDLPPLGRTVQIEIALPEQPDVVALPPSALYENDRIYAVEGGRLEAIDVERVGDARAPDGELQVLVRSPALAGGRLVVTTQLPRATPGLLVSQG